jgi:tetratricopeptide (TPR) repeat protein
LLLGRSLACLAQHATTTCKLILKLLSSVNESPETIRLTQVLATYRRILDADLTSAAKLNQRGFELMRANLHADALTCLERAISIEPELVAAHFYRAQTLHLLGRKEDALASFHHATTLDPRNAELFHNIGILQYELGDPHQASASYDLAISMQTPSAFLLNSRGYCLHNLGRLQDAKESYLKALTLMPDLSSAKLNLGITCLMLGEWEEGWQGYEARWHGAYEASKGNFDTPPTSLPQWHGNDINAHDSLLVFSEQGLGDSLQFGRYLLLAAQRFSRVSFVCPAPLQRLFLATFSSQIDILDAVPEDQSDWQWQCPLMSLPKAFGTTPNNIPHSTSYLKIKNEWIDKWRTRLPVDRRLRVGLVWSGFKGHKNDARRSIPLHKFSSLLNRDDIVWINLQKGDGAEQLAVLPLATDMLNWTSEINDFADTAALISQLDLVVTIDTSVVHRAGALGKPVWMLNRFESEWRWLRDREDSPWYASLRIFNQTFARDWEEVLIRMNTALTDTVQKHAMSHGSNQLMNAESGVMS